LKSPDSGQGFLFAWRSAAQPEFLDSRLDTLAFHPFSGGKLALTRAKCVYVSLRGDGNQATPG